MDDPARLVAAGYDAVGADAYAALEDESDEWPRARHVADLIGRLAPGAAVLDLGCGNGVPAARDLANAGLTVTGVDVSEKQVARAHAAVPDATFLVDDMRGASFESGSLDAVISLYAIGHVPRSEHRAIVRSIHRWLRPGGLLLLATEDSDRPDEVGTWLGEPMFFSTRSADEWRRIVGEAGFELLHMSVETQVEGGAEIPYVWILGQRSHDQSR